MTDSPDSGGSVRARAARTLGLTADSSAPASRTLLLSRLAAEEFAPPEDCIAALDRRLFDWFAQETTLAPVPPQQSPTNELDSPREAPREACKVRSSQSHVRRSNTQANHWADWSAVHVVLWLVVVVIQGISSSSGSARPTTAYSPGPTNHQPILDKPNFSRTQIEAFKRYEQDRKGDQPPGYVLYQLYYGTIDLFSTGGRGRPGTTPTTRR